MAEIEVEPVDEVADVPEDVVPAGVDAPEYVLYGGKGGVGKTTMAAATALASARGGVPTLVVSTDPAHSLSDAFGTDVPANPARIHDDLPLYGAEIDPDAALEDAGPFGADGSLGGLGDLFGGGAGGDAGERAGGGQHGDPPPGDDAGGLLGGGMPGADEAAAMQVLLTHLDDERFERVVVDTAPTGHTLRLLQLPEAMDTMVGRLLRLRERLQGLLDGVGGLFGGDDAGDDLGDLRTLRDRVERLRAALRDPERTDFRVVLVPERMSVVEARRLLARLAEFEIPVGTVVVNRVMEDLADVAGDVEADWYVSPRLDDCEFCRRRWDVQQAALSEAHEVFRGHDVKRVPLFADEVRGEAMLRVVAACLE